VALDDVAERRAKLLADIEQVSLALSRAVTEQLA
jgi:hypothetical protein